MEPGCFLLCHSCRASLCLRLLPWPLLIFSSWRLPAPTHPAPLVSDPLSLPPGLCRLPSSPFPDPRPCAWSTVFQPSAAVPRAPAPCTALSPVPPSPGPQQLLLAPSGQASVGTLPPWPGLRGERQQHSSPASPAPPQARGLVPPALGSCLPWHRAPASGPLPPVSRPSRCLSLQAWVLPARDTESGKWCDRGSTEFLTSCFITVTAHHSGGKQVVKMASRNNCKQGDSVVYGRNAVKGETSVTRKKICDVQWPAWPSGLIMAEALCPYGEKSSQNSCGVSQGLLQLLLSRKDLLVVDKWKTGNHQLLFQFWAGRRSAAATCAILLPALAWPAACGEGNGLCVLRCECHSGL